MNKVIRVEDLSKAYQLGEIGTGTLSRDLERYWARFRGKEDPFLKIGEVNDPATKSESNIIWSLKNINFEVEQGDAVGIIGRNGAGKSTLLKILSRVTSPTTGSVKIKGRVASLLEVGTGFHPELSGRENIYLNGAILGMRKVEIKRKFDEIVDFSGVERYIDTPVKRYSSGMYVRLAFAVAAHLESEILIVDEVLAVGDAEFQKKCTGKIGSISKGEGKTVLFVSHQMATIQKLCKCSILLNKGMLEGIGETAGIINDYMNSGTASTADYHFTEQKNAHIGYIKSLSIRDHQDKPAGEILQGKSWTVRVTFVITEQVKNLVIALGMFNAMDIPIRTSWASPGVYSPGTYIADFLEEDINFTPGRYRLAVGISIGRQSIQYIDHNLFLYISEVAEQADETILLSNGIIFNQMKISVNQQIIPRA